MTKIHDLMINIADVTRFLTPVSSDVRTNLEEPPSALLCPMCLPKRRVKTVTEASRILFSSRLHSFGWASVP
jgi:hypothetical protein